MNMAKIGFVSYPGAPTLTPDDRLVFEPLAELGGLAVALVWSDESVRWGEYAAVVVRSTWDYHLVPDSFRTWLDRMERDAIPLWNPTALIRWNMNKTYLRELEVKGVSIPATVWPSVEGAADLGAILTERDWDRAVVKPTISGSAFSTWVTRRASAKADHRRFSEMLQAGQVMVQRFEQAVVDGGEWSLVFLGGEFSHAVLKRPEAGDFRVQQQFGGTITVAEPPESALAAARAALRLVEFPWLYARVDMVHSEGRWLLMELEMLEPDLFLRTNEAAPHRFARAIAAVSSAGRPAYR
ncbi:MAG: hypothetical protein ABI679_13780 [Gemmatimonadota bacterium]